MKIPAHWTKGAHTDVDPHGRQRTVSVWGWSCESLAKARQHAEARARRAFDRWTSGAKADSYDYLEHPLREEIVQALGPAGEPHAVITRNRYGALVLNTAAVCFVDVDFPAAQPAGLLDGLRLLFSARSRQERAASSQQATLQAVKDWAGRNRGRSFRLYQTAAGLRLLFTDRLYQPDSAETTRLLDELGSDELYRRLTLKQECFRARLTPKPWRCGCRRPPNRYPWESTQAERKYRQWQENYERKSSGYGVCRLLEVFGPGAEDAAIREVLRVHDEQACREGEARLA